MLKNINDYFDEVDSNLYEISYAVDEGVKARAHYYKRVALFHLNNLKEAKIHLIFVTKHGKENIKKQ